MKKILVQAPLLSCHEEKKHFNVVRSLACEMRVDEQKLRLLSRFKKDKYNGNLDETKLTYNIFDDSQHLCNSRLDQLYLSKVPNPFQAIFEKNNSKKKKRFRRMMTLMNETCSENPRSSKSIATLSSLKQNQQEPPIKQQILKEDYEKSYLLHGSRRSHSENISRQFSSVSQLSLQNKTKAKESEIKTKARSLPARGCLLPKISQPNSYRFTNAETNKLEKNCYIQEIQSKKQLADLIGGNYFQMMLRSRYKQEFKHPQCTYLINSPNVQPTSFVKKLKKMHPQIMKVREKLLVKGRKCNSPPKLKNSSVFVSSGIN